MIVIGGMLLGLLTTEPAVFAQQSRSAVVAHEVPRLLTDCRATSLKQLGPESPISRRYYALLNRYVRYAEKGLKAWPAEPGAEFHKQDGSAEHAVRQNASVAMAFAVLASSGDFDEGAAGVRRAQVRADAAALLRYLSVTHAANFLPTGDGKRWGDEWQSAYWAAIAGTAAWLLWDDLPDDTKVMAARMIIHEADRFNTRPPDSGEAHDTKAEENAWNSEVIALAACMFQQHPHAGVWREQAIVWMMNSYSAAADSQDSTMVDGRPMKDRMTTTNIHPDFTLENHGRVHPDYVSCFALVVQNAILYELAGLKPPAAVFHHAKDCNAVCLSLTATNGNIFYINGQDWYPHRPDVPLMTSGLMSTFSPDAETACAELCALTTIEKMHSRFQDGRLFDPREYNYPNAEEELIVLYAENYLAHRLCGDFPTPVSAPVFQHDQSGSRIFHAGGFVTHRTPGKFVSFCWVNDVMGLIYPSDDTWFTAPYQRGLMGRIEVDGVKDGPPRTEAHTVSLLHLAGPVSNDGFALVGKFSRCEGKIEQRAAIISLPDRPVLFVERLRARKDVNVKEIATATVAVLNEDAGVLSPNQRHVWTEAGEQTMRGAANESARVHVWKSTWANVDDKLGLAAQASGRMSYREDHRYEHARLQQELAANYLAELGPRKAGEILAESVVEFLPNASHAEPVELRVERLGDGGFRVQTGGWRTLVNLTDSPIETGPSGQVQIPALSAIVQNQAAE